MLFQSNEPDYKALHLEIIKYLQFLKEKSTEGQIEDGLLKAWFYFKEVPQTWLGFAQVGNGGRGLAAKFARAININLGKLYNDAGANISRDRHFEKLGLFSSGVGRDTISDFTTNLIKPYLLKFTQDFAINHLTKDQIAEFTIPRIRFNYQGEYWESESYVLPKYANDFVILTPRDLLSRDDTWINKTDLYRDFESLPDALPDPALRAQINHYFRSLLSTKPAAKEIAKAKKKTIEQYPILLDCYIKMKEDNGSQSKSISSEKISEAQVMFLENFMELQRLLSETTEFYSVESDSLEASRARLNFLKHVIEDKDGYRYFYDSKRNPIAREDDLQIAYNFCWFGSSYDVNREVNNGRGPADYVVSRGRRDSTVVEFKLASNSQLERTIQKQADIYRNASDSEYKLYGILCFTRHEQEKCSAVLAKYGLESSNNIVMIDDRRDNKPSASRA